MSDSDDDDLLLNAPSFLNPPPKPSKSSSASSFDSQTLVQSRNAKKKTSDMLKQFDSLLEGEAVRKEKKRVREDKIRTFAEEANKAAAAERAAAEESSSDDDDDEEKKKKEENLKKTTSNFNPDNPLNLGSSTVDWNLVKAVTLELKSSKSGRSGIADERAQAQRIEDEEELASSFLIGRSSDFGARIVFNTNAKRPSGAAADYVPPILLADYEDDFGDRRRLTSPLISPYCDFAALKTYSSCSKAVTQLARALQFAEFNGVLEHLLTSDSVKAFCLMNLDGDGDDGDDDDDDDDGDNQIPPDLVRWFLDTAILGSRAFSPLRLSSVESTTHRNIESTTSSSSSSAKKQQLSGAAKRNTTTTEPHEWVGLSSTFLADGAALSLGYLLEGGMASLDIAEFGRLLRGHLGFVAPTAVEDEDEENEVEKTKEKKRKKKRGEDDDAMDDGKDKSGDKRQDQQLPPPPDTEGLSKFLSIWISAFASSSSTSSSTSAALRDSSSPAISDSSLIAIATDLVLVGLDPVVRKSAGMTEKIETLMAEILDFSCPSGNNINDKKTKNRCYRKGSSNTSFLASLASSIISETASSFGDEKTVIYSEASDEAEFEGRAILPLHLACRNLNIISLQSGKACQVVAAFRKKS
jgi:hypothetical protein